MTLEIHYEEEEKEEDNFGLLTKKQKNNSIKHLIHYHVPVRCLLQYACQFGNVTFIFHNNLLVVVDTHFGALENVLDQIFPVDLKIIQD